MGRVVIDFTRKPLVGFARNDDNVGWLFVGQGRSELELLVAFFSNGTIQVLIYIDMP